jgi:hypothetical protein
MREIERAAWPMSKRNGKARARAFPRRRWEQITDLIELTLATAYVIVDTKEPRPASLILYGLPGMGKTELLERFRPNGQLSFHSDITVRQLYPLLTAAKKGALTHLVFTEFQKLFQRKGSVAENCIGTMAQAIEEGVQTVSVGPQEMNFGGARFGVVGAMTARTFRRKYDTLAEMGFLDRVAFVEFDFVGEEIEDVIHRIDRGDRSDLTPRLVPTPPEGKAVRVEFPVKVAGQLSAAMLKILAGRSSTAPPLRQLQRLRRLAGAAAVMRKADVVHSVDVDRVMQFADILMARPRIVETEI